MTSWRELKTERRLRGKAKRAYEDARRAMGVGYLVLKARAAAALTQDELARALGTSQSMVARWEGGTQVPSVRTLMRIAEATGFRLALGFQDSGRRRTDFLALGVLEPAAAGADVRIVRERRMPYAAPAPKKSARRPRRG
jgi:transcriptional regulator with XRE-family HTH domain